MRFVLRAVLLVGVAALLLGVAHESTVSAGRERATVRCPVGAAHAIIAGKHVCLREGQRCKKLLDRRYHRYGFHCHTGRLARTKPKPPPPRFVSLRVAGSEQVVFDWTTDRCEDVDIPDLPARAFRDAEGRVQLISAHYVNRRFVGPDLDQLAHGCEVVMDSDYNADPAAFDDREWISSTWTPDGRTVYALIHNEYQGNTHPGQCASGIYLKCWYNAITLAVSSDGGRTYLDQPPPRIVATVPNRYVSDDGPIGIFNPSNIVRNGRDGYYYALVRLNIRDSTFGDCLIRTKDLADASSWRAWSRGTAFETTFIDPYGSNPNLSAQLCTGVSPDQLGDLVPGSLTYNTVARQWLLVGVRAGGFFFTLSPDLIHWSAQKLFYPSTVPWTYQCGDADPVHYPSLIDPTSSSRNFETTGRFAFLYFTQFHTESCVQGLDRDLMRVKIEVHP